MKFAKLTIKAYEKPEDTSVKKTFTALINPETLSTDYRIIYNNKQASGTTVPQLKFQNIQSGKVSFTLIFDGTGLISTAKESYRKKTVPEQIDQFINTTIKYQGSIHRPYYLSLIWGKSLFFKGFLTDLSIKHKLFKQDGTPIRSEANVTFQTSDSAAHAARRAGKKSPDMTHIRKIMAGDRLPNMCNKIYDGVNYYIQVAKHNQLNHLRSLKPGNNLSFPPIID